MSRNPRIRSVFLVDFLEGFQPSQVPFAGDELCVDEGADDFEAEVGAGHAGGDDQEVHVVLEHALICRTGIVANRGPHAGDLVGGDAGADAETGDGDSSIDFVGCESFGHGCNQLGRVVFGFERGCAEIDRDAAVAAGYPDVVAPTLFTYVVRMHASALVPPDQLEPDGSPSADVPPLPTRRAMAGETRVVLGERVVAGDVIRVQKRLAQMYEKEGRSGPLVFVVLALLGFVLVSTFTMSVVLGQAYLPRNPGLASGLIVGFAIGAGGVGATGLGWVADHWGLTAALAISASMPIAGFVAALFLPDPRTGDLG